MKQILFVFFLMSAACSTATVETSTNLKGTWSWENVVLTNSTNPVLEKHVLVLDENSYHEVLFKNSVSQNYQKGTFNLNMNKGSVELTTSNENGQTTYKGYVSGNQLMINSTNGISLNPPILYRRH